MAIITTTKSTEKLSNKLQRNGVNQFVVKTSGDKFGKYLRFVIGGKCCGGCGWSIKEAEEIVNKTIAQHNSIDIQEFYNVA